MRINIVCAIDSSYVKHCAVMLHSLRCHNPQVELSVFILHNGLVESLKNKLSAFLSSFLERLEFITIDDTLLVNCPISHHITVASYFRLFIPEVLPQDMRKALFLDSDIIVRKNILSLWETNISSYSHAAIEDPVSVDNERLDIPPLTPYFNAGVLLINIDFWRQENLFSKAIEFINHHSDKILWHDQDVLNSLLHSYWLPVEPKWNSQSTFFDEPFLKRPEASLSTYQEAILDPAIVHFTGSGNKPWNHQCSHPFKDDYRDHLRQTPWAINPLIEVLNQASNNLKKKIKIEISRLSKISQAQ